MITLKSELQSGMDVLQQCLAEYSGHIAVISSFGAESAVLLALVADLDRSTPVLFLQTGQHFPETLRYRQDLAAALGLRDVRDIRPAPGAVASRDPAGALHAFDADACCALRKVEPLEQALAPFAAWITGRKRSQAATRAAMPLTEWEGNRLKVNPLAEWSLADVETEMLRRGLPRHPLLERGYRSIGCAPCTQPTAPGMDPRSGRWSATSKTECGIHRPMEHTA